MGLQGKNYATRSLIVALALGVGVAIGGCASTPADETAGDSATEQTQGESRAEEQPAEEGGAAADIVDEDGEIPGWMLDAFPLYPGSEVAGAGESGGMTMISFFAPDDEATLYAWFIEQYGQNGWTVTETDDENSAVSATYADGHEAWINVTKATYVIEATPA